MRKPFEVTFFEYFCDSCGQKIGDDLCGDPSHHGKDGGEYCSDCALKKGLIAPLTWLNLCGLAFYDHATFENGHVIGFQKWGRGFRKDIFLIE